MVLFVLFVVLRIMGYTNGKMKIGFFNINGLVGETSFNPDFSKTLAKYDIITLTETWHRNTDCIQKIKNNFPNDFSFIDNARKNKNKKIKRNSGGILVCYKNGLKKETLSPLINQLKT